MIKYVTLRESMRVNTRGIEFFLIRGVAMTLFDECKKALGIYIYILNEKDEAAAINLLKHIHAFRASLDSTC
ncbi:hypothetical protein AGJ18_14805 [Cronobacter sakazakii]|nr:hypothetical protein [Cronobacter sakazakii]PPY09538.1 hypothetical protein C3D82_15500 [Cronobacter sakazakii]PQV65835.1 hypothetical protein CDT97_20295 [Cronobacter sakazakii]PQV84638.1 hypothetical protein CDT87_14145 [Cronobacter sakazakii]PQV91748.1 hypothetical protein CDT93_14090 [Cronobacter sakazakii]